MSIGGLDLVLFDLGGVLIELSGVGAMQKLAGIAGEDELWERWLSCPWVRAFERGECSAEEFATGMVEEWSLAVTPAEFLAAFRDWPVGPMPGAEDLVAEVAAVVAVGCLSNTNSLHTEDQFSRWGIFAAFEPRFLSHELGVLKPDRELFERVSELAGIAPARILFLDDNLINVEGARAAGFVAEHARGVDGARAALEAQDVLTAVHGRG
ncbi:MAG: HAD family phosphatase [Acidimicrobiia bacterium]